MLTVLGILAALAFGFVFGRIWQIRRDELERSFALPPVARIPSEETQDGSWRTSVSSLVIVHDKCPTHGRPRGRLSPAAVILDSGHSG
jgi:hypothetical protein